jgi:hypothetical protein
MSKNTLSRFHSGYIFSFGELDECSTISCCYYLPPHFLPLILLATAGESWMTLRIFNSGDIHTGIRFKEIAGFKRKAQALHRNPEVRG